MIFGVISRASMKTVTTMIRTAPQSHFHGNHSQGGFVIKPPHFDDVGDTIVTVIFIIAGVTMIALLVVLTVFCCVASRRLRRHVTLTTSCAGNERGSEAFHINQEYSEPDEDRTEVVELPLETIYEESNDFSCDGGDRANPVENESSDDNFLMSLEINGGTHDTRSMTSVFLTQRPGSRANSESAVLNDNTCVNVPGEVDGEPII
ncbi:uncharacterized protein LOC116616581 isoform X2 [Nematostella vectensis]|uniref:uncharacterized protein LOC116616581 isoform X2 n=1 Tax=Nematostella vectensis TaxID=45351 RepID=UPI002076F23D|nr:uncharacterized protein LOC116616581 isoform X2 [Nematostella vectensis]